MRVTTKGQVTIPQHIRELLNITPATEVDFVQDEGKVYLVKKNQARPRNSVYAKLRGVATAQMSTDEIMTLTRGD